MQDRSSSEPTANALETYLPEKGKKGTALCLSGGGFRAALFHLGALRRLNELGVLSQLDTISAVSGGSVLAAHLANSLRPWPDSKTRYQEWDRHVALPFRRFAGGNIRTGPLLRRLLPWNWFRQTTAVDALAVQYRALTRLDLVELPARPRFVFCATDLALGVNWVFEALRMGDYQLGYIAPPHGWSVAQAVAASSCFPPIFAPLRLHLSPEAFTIRGKLPDEVRGRVLASPLPVTDGGLYDNLGLEPVWKSHACVLVSDGGATFDAEQDRGIVWRLSRYLTILGTQAVATRKRWLISNFLSRVLAGTYWGIGSDVRNYGATDGYSAALVDDVISEVRTDLDAFNEAEASVLENHGYLLAEAAIRRHAPELIAIDAPLGVPHPGWMDEARVREAITSSHRRRLLGRFS